jgi:transglutaminase-like putative cysteine protease
VAAGRSAIWWLLLWGLAASIPWSAHAAEYQLGPAPAWVVPSQPGVSGSAQAGKGSDGATYRLVDTQILAGQQQRVRYRRTVVTAFNTSGVDVIANIEIPFDPSYQTLTLHAVDVVRDGHRISKLASARIEVLHREDQREARIYDGTKTVNIVLDDVRVGDTVDYAYSTTGSNPVFGGRRFGSIALQYGVPVERIHARLLLPRDAQVQLDSPHLTTQPVVSEHDGLRDLNWNVIDAPAVTVEKGAPDGYSPYAEVAWSEFADWGAVARWAMPLYRVPSALDPALQAQVERIRQAEASPVGRMLAALRLVQSDVRYLGVEIGPNSHAPNPPALVFARRFGDCKDKTLLTLALLHHLGIEAHAALVNTRLRRGIADGLPNPGAFDHVLVQAQVDGKTWWIDPTRYTQEADAAHLVQPDYGVALVVAPGVRSLTSMDRPGESSSGRSLRVTFDGRAGFDKPVPFTVDTTTFGEEAEALRATLASTSLDDLQKRYLNFYANDYPHISVASPLQVRDDKAANRIVTTEHYLIADIASPATDHAGKVARFFASDIDVLLRDPEVTIRKAPLALDYPRDVSEHTEILLPEDWPIKPGVVTVDDPAFRFEQRIKLEGLRLVITRHFRALSDAINADDMHRYLANLARARRETGYELWWNDARASDGTPPAAKPSALDRVNWVVALLALGMLGAWSWLARAAYRYDPAPSGDIDEGLVGIRGWLLWLGVSLVLRPVVFLVSLSQLGTAMSMDNWAALTTFGSSTYNALWAPLLLVELAVGLGQLVFSLLLLVLFFQRRSSFPRLAIALLAASVVLQAADVALGSLLPAGQVEPSDIAKIIRAALLVAIWSAYLLRSERVSSTFVVRYRSPTPPPLPRAEIAGEEA